MVNRSPAQTGRVVKASRAYSGMSREELGETVDISPSTLGKIERSERLPKQWEWNAIAEVCEVKRDFIDRAGEAGYTPFLPQAERSSR